MWMMPLLPYSVIEIVHPWVRKGNLQHRVMMFSMDYPSYSHRKPNRHIGCLHPVTSRVPVSPPFACSAGHPLSLHYNKSRKMNHRTERLWYLPSCACGSREMKHPFGLCLSTPSPLYTHKHPGRRSHSIHTCHPFPSTLQQPNNLEPAKRVKAAGAWDHLPEDLCCL
jgi:hypothetical protein